MLRMGRGRCWHQAKFLSAMVRSRTVAGSETKGTMHLLSTGQEHKFQISFKRFISEDCQDEVDGKDPEGWKIPRRV
jgi:hypothetical protein